MEILWDGLVPYKYMYIVAWVAVLMIIIMLRF